MKDLLPQNYRRIPARISTHFSVHKKLYFTVLVSLESACAVGLLAIGVILFLNYAALKQGRVGEEKSLNSWEKLAVKYPNYPQVYFNAALHAQRLGDSQKALEYVNKALSLNPNLSEAQTLRRDITKQ